MGEGIGKILKKIEKRYYVAFITTFVLGMLTHMYAFTNQVQNHDYYSNVRIDQFWWPLELGRCFLWPFTTISSYFSLPWVLGLLSMIYLSVAMCIIVSIYDIRNYLAIILCGAIFISHPAITDLIGYLFTMDGYCVGIVFSCVAIFIFEKVEGKRKIIGFVAFATLAIGIYQANLSFILYLVFIKAILDIYSEKRVSKEFFKKYFLYGLLIVISFLLYFACLKGIQSLAGVQMSSYAGFNTASLPSPDKFVKTLWRDAVEFIHRFVGSDFKFTAYEIFNMLFAICFIVTNIKVIVERKICKSLPSVITILVILVMMVYSTSIYDFATDDLWYRWEMMQCVPLWYVMFIVLIDRYWMGTIQNIMVVLAGVISFNFFLIANITYLNQELAFEQTFAQTSLIVNQIYSLDGYSEDMPIYVIGQYEEERRDWLLDRIPENMTVDNTIMQDFLSVTKYNMGITFKIANNEEMEKINSQVDFSKIPNWPNKGSVDIIDGVVIIKFAGRM